MTKKVPDTVKKFDKKLPHFSDGRIDYSDSKVATTTVAFLKFDDEILLLRRSNKVNSRKNKWGVVAGYLDEVKPVIEKVKEEVKEETGVGEDEILFINKNKVFEFEMDGVKYHSHPVLVELKRKPDVDLNWEHTEYRWVRIKNVEHYLPENALKELRLLLKSQKQE